MILDPNNYAIDGGYPRIYPSIERGKTWVTLPSYGEMRVAIGNVGEE